MKPIIARPDALALLIATAYLIQVVHGNVTLTDPFEVVSAWARATSGDWLFSLERRQAPAQ
jgi:hypothetical protein